VESVGWRLTNRGQGGRGIRKVRFIARPVTRLPAREIARKRVKRLCAPSKREVHRQEEVGVTRTSLGSPVRKRMGEGGDLREGKRSKGGKKESERPRLYVFAGPVFKKGRGKYGNTIGSSGRGGGGVGRRCLPNPAKRRDRQGKPRVHV